VSQLSSHSNVYNTCLRILRKKGFQLITEYEVDENQSIIPSSQFWRAIKNGYELVASNPIELLGLATIYEYKQPSDEPSSYWWTVDGENIWEELNDAADVSTS
jgi:hypothetical protein